MKYFKRISALIIAGAIGSTYICSSVPVYALNGTSTPYYASVSEFVTGTEEMPTMPEPVIETATPGAIMVTATPGAVMETENPEETMFPETPGEAALPSEEPKKESTVSPLATVPVTNNPNKTKPPVFTSAPMPSSFPIKTNVPTNVPIRTNVPVKTNIPTNVPVRTNVPVKTNIPMPTVKETVIPVYSEKPDENSSPIKTSQPIDNTPKKTSLPADTPGAPGSTAATQKPNINVNEEYCVITYQLNGGTNHKNNPIKVKKKGVSVVLNAPSKAKYTFAGWYTDAKYTNKITAVGNTSLSFLTLYAKWKKVTVKQAVFSYAKKNGASSILVKVKKESGVAGFEYVYAKDWYFKRKYRLHTKKNPKTLSKLTKKKTYYIKVRAYKLDSTGKKVYGIYSRIKKVKLKN